MIRDLFHHVASYLLSIVIGGIVGLALMMFAIVGDIAGDIARFIIGCLIGIPLLGYVCARGIIAYLDDDPLEAPLPPASRTYPARW